MPELETPGGDVTLQLANINNTGLHFDTEHHAVHVITTYIPTSVNRTRAGKAGQ